jgi:N-acetylneuraminic acid mutarotase
MTLMNVAKIGVALILLGLVAGCGGGGGAPPPPPPPASQYTATSGVAQKGPLILGSSVTAQELSTTLAPTGKQYSYLTDSDLGTFQPNSSFTSQYIGVNATGYYFDEAANAVSGGTITLNGYSDLSSVSVLNVNLLTTLAYQRIQNLVSKSGKSFTAATTQAQNEVLAAFSIQNGSSFGGFSSLDMSKGSDGDHILVALSSLFVFGNTSGNLASLIATVQSDLAANGAITSPATKAVLAAAAKALDPNAIAANLTARYSSAGVTFTASDITDWIDTDGDGVVGKFKFQVDDATPTSQFSFPAFVSDPQAGNTIAVSAGQLIINGTPASGPTQIKSGDVVTVAPSPGVFPNGVLTVYLLAGTTRIARVSFVRGLATITVSPANPTIQVGATEGFSALGTFTDGSTLDLTASLSWQSSAVSVATVNSTTGAAKAIAVGAATISATSGSVSGSATLTVIPAALQTITVTPNPFTTGVGIARKLTATGTYSDGTTADLTSAAVWSTSKPSVATVSGGIVTGVALGSTTITATVGSVSGTSALSVTAGVWAPAEPLSTTWKISSHTATLLNSGKLLIAGGSCSIGIVCGYTLSTAQLYDAVQDVWVPVGSMATQRYSHTATLLPNGTVVVTGGTDQGSMSQEIPLASVEVFDPATNAWTTSAPMSTARSSHVAALLHDGRVLVAGGSTLNRTILVYNTTAEIFDPASGTWAATANNATGRIGGTATVLPDGRVLVAGGDVVEIYDPATGTWSAAASLHVGRSYHTATLLNNGQVLVAGGVVTSGTQTASTEVYDSSTNTWTAAGTMTIPRMNHTATLLPDGNVLVVGGNPASGYSALATAEIYSPSSGTWTSAASMAHARNGHTATLLSDHSVFVTGGDDYGLLATSERYW